MLLWGRAFLPHPAPAPTSPPGDGTDRPPQPPAARKRPGAAQEDCGAPREVPGGGRWQQVSLGWHHCLALDHEGHVWALGSDRHGQLGTGGAAPTLDLGLSPPGPEGCGHAEGPPLPMPRRVRGLPQEVPFASVSAGSEHSMALSADGRLYVWGWNEHGQVGDGTRRDARLPLCVRPPAGKAEEIEGEEGRRCSIAACGGGFTLAVWS
jgi:hypothetical protein